MMNKLLYSAIYTIFGVAVLGGTLFAGRYVSRGTYADTNYILTSGLLVGGLVFYAIAGIVRPRQR